MVMLTQNLVPGGVLGGNGKLLPPVSRFLTERYVVGALTEVVRGIIMKMKRSIATLMQILVFFAKLFFNVFT